jgi:hypothetical protein
LRRVRDRIDREYALPLNVEALTRDAGSTYRYQTAGVTAGLPSCMEKQVTRPVRNREAPSAALPLA